MKQTVTLEVENNMVLQILRNFAAMHLVKFTDETPSQSNFSCSDLITASYDEVYSKEDSSLEPCVIMAQAEIIEGDDW